MLEKKINGFSVVAYATQPEGRTPPRAFLETRRLVAKVKEGEAGAQQAADPDGAEPAAAPPEGQPFEIFVSRRFRSAIEAMSAARNALDRVTSVDEDGVPDPLPE
ncbi:hypothetical protein YH64_027090 [Achromobacter sp. LC458]|uniref:hypothetical protein n=1 Tax=unclassified Achromobacter TaxID=2626865 RepID=UPI00062A106B|nr:MULTISPECIES: hypothetical protein [unclassified Achromobacter]MDX3985862.1 hypothetical protein [Achromobacter sp.]QYJ23526.1 hypothetical protein KYT87_10040 [Achromobacter sp. ES-001]TRM49874.1 hypothetical protein YH64_027090 [Achromobacter sp. LC458]